MSFIEEDKNMILSQIIHSTEYKKMIKSELDELVIFLKKYCDESKDEKDNEYLCNSTIPKTKKDRQKNRKIIGEFFAKGNTGRIYISGLGIIKASVDDNFSQQTSLHELFINLLFINSALLKIPNFIKTKGFFLCKQKETKERDISLKKIIKFCTNGKDDKLRFNMIQERLDEKYVSFLYMIENNMIQLEDFIIIIMKVCKVMNKLYHYDDSFCRHNDLHVGNIMVNPNNIIDIVIIDFALASLFYKGHFYTDTSDVTNELLFIKYIIHLHNIDNIDNHLDNIRKSCLYDLLFLFRSSTTTPNKKIKLLCNNIIKGFSRIFDIDLLNDKIWLYKILLHSGKTDFNSSILNMKNITYHWVKENITTYLYQTIKDKDEFLKITEKLISLHLL